MKRDDPIFKASSDFGVDDIPGEAVVARRMLRRLEEIDNSGTPGRTSAVARATLASSAIAHALELETQLDELKQPAQAK
jgi:hypothetical protein